MTQLCGQLRSLHLHQSGVKLLCVVDSHLLTVDTAVPLSLFAVEAVTNSYRHGFPDNRVGTIVLSFSVQGAEGRMQIEDDGIGFDPSNAFTSMGHQLMSAFSHQLGGTLDMKSADSGGTMVTLTYPLNGTHSAN